MSGGFLKKLKMGKAFISLILSMLLIFGAIYAWNFRLDWLAVILLVAALVLSCIFAKARENGDDDEIDIDL